MFGNKTRKAELCTPCAKGMCAEGFRVRPVKRGVNQKVTCERCGRRRYGGVFELGGNSLKDSCVEKRKKGRRSRE